MLTSQAERARPTGFMSPVMTSNTTSPRVHQHQAPLRRISSAPHSSQSGLQAGSSLGLGSPLCPCQGQGGQSAGGGFGSTPSEPHVQGGRYTGNPVGGGCRETPLPRKGNAITFAVPAPQRQASHNELTVTAPRNGPGSAAAALHGLGLPCD